MSAKESWSLRSLPSPGQAGSWRAQSILLETRAQFYSYSSLPVSCY